MRAATHVDDRAEVGAWLLRAVVQAETLAQVRLAAILASTTLEQRAISLDMMASDAGLSAADADAAFGWLWRSGLASFATYDGSRHVSIERAAAG